jgi:ankyrin repeat protein
MEDFKYEPIDLKECTFRLLRLFKGDHGPIQCDLFHASLYDTENAMEYEALSYTWGGTNKPLEIEINKRRMPVTENLFLALHDMRYLHQDRILWIDAICVDQENPQERGHQVQQMGSIYKGAERVVIWLGKATFWTDIAFEYMQALEQQAVGHAYNTWRSSDERWQLLWSNVLLLLSKRPKDAQRLGFEDLLRRSWFTRVWILQEVANARSAIIICGTGCVSPRIFAVTLTLVAVTPNVHCQAVLDIMPGFSRRYSWWAENRDLRTLLSKFKKSQASDPRDNIYALLGISTDNWQNSILVPDYNKSEENVIHDSIAYLLYPYDRESSMAVMLKWTMYEFLDRIDALESEVLHWAAENGHEAVVKLLLDTENVNSQDHFGRTPLLWAAMKGHEAVVKLLLNTENVNSQDQHGRTSLSWAAENGHEAVVKLLLGTDKVDIHLEDKGGFTPLFRAAVEGHEVVTKLLVETERADFDFKDHLGSTPLLWAARKGHKAVVKLLLETGKVNVDVKDREGRTPLSWAAKNGHEAVVKLLLETGNIEADSNDQDSCGRQELASRSDLTTV